MEEKIELTEEQIKALQNALELISEAVAKIAKLITDVLKPIFEAVKKLYISIGRSLFKAQLLEIKTPYWIANYISEKIYWYWACKFGFAWLENKLMV